MSEFRGLPMVRVVAFSPRRRHPYGARKFMIASYVGLEELQERIADRSVGQQAIRVLIAMLCECDYENRVRLGQKDLARRLSMDQAAVSKAIGDLVKCGFIERPENSRGDYHVSPRLCWKGSDKELRQALARRGMLDQDGMMTATAA
jgi:DNA-binding GntR family transcriptional regulator